MGTEEKERPQILPHLSPPTPQPPPLVTLGKAKDPGLILGILLNILGLAAAPLQSPPPAH